MCGRNECNRGKLCDLFEMRETGGGGVWVKMEGDGELEPYTLFPASLVRP